MQTITVKMDNKGRITIPFPIRKERSLQKGSTFNMDSFEDTLILKPTINRCVFCFEPADKQLCGRFVCDECRNDLKAVLQ